MKETDEFETVADHCLVHDHYKLYFRYAALHVLCNAHHLIPILPSKHELRSHSEPLELRWNSSQ